MGGRKVGASSPRRSLTSDVDKRLSSSHNWMQHVAKARGQLSSTLLRSSRHRSTRAISVSASLVSFRLASSSSLSFLFSSYSPLYASTAHLHRSQASRPRSSLTRSKFEPCPVPRASTFTLSPSSCEQVPASRTTRQMASPTSSSRALAR